MTTAHPFFAACGTLGDVGATPAGSAAQDVLAANGLPTTSSGGVQAISQATGLPTNLTQAQTAAFNALPPSVQATIKSAQTDAATAAPAIALASTIASGGSPSAAEIIGGLAAVATLATGNPLVGATIGAIASVGAVAEVLLTNLFDALGLYSHVPSYSYVGFLRKCPTPPTAGCENDQVPSGPSDPFWIDVSTFDKLETFYAHGDANHPGLSGQFDSSMVNLLYNAFVQGMTPAEAAKATGQNPYQGYLDANAWDAYFATLMIANLQFWANGKAYVPPRTLLTGAVQAWNAIHGSTATKIYSPPAPGTPACSSLLSLTSMVLGPCGDSVEAAANGGVVVDVPPVTVNLGAILPNVVAAAQEAAAAELQGGAAPAASSSSTGTIVAVSAVGLVAGGAIWAGLTGRLAGLARWLQL